MFYGHRRRLSLAPLFLGAFLLAYASPAQGQESDEAAVVRGFVRNAANGQSLQGANVVLRDSTGSIQAAVATDADGFYLMTGLDPGSYRLTISFVGFEAHRDTLRLARGERRTVSVSLSESPRRLEEVTIEGREPVQEAEPGLRRIRTADIETIPTPGPGSDLSSYLRGLPGVTTTGDRGGRLYVRGGTPSQNLVLVDGIPLYKPFHIIGLYSAFPGTLVSSADFYAGGFGADYMGRISSVLDVQLRPGNTKRYEGSVGIGPFLASTRIEGPLLEGFSSLLVHARHSLVEQSGPTLLGQDTPYEFYDVTAKMHTQNASSQCSFTGVRTYDRGRIDPDRASSFRWDNTGLGGQCLVFGEQSAQVLDVSFGTTRFNNSVQSPDGTTREAGTWRLYTNFDLEQPVSWADLLHWSINVRADKYDYSLDEPFLGVTTEDEFLITSSSHFGAEWTWDNGLTLTPTVGALFPLSWGELSIEPRLRLSYRPGDSDRMKLTAAGGLYRQLVSGVTDERDAGSTFQALIPTPFQDRPLQAVHALLGWNQRLSDQVRFSVEGWYKDLRNLPVPQWTPIVRFNTNVARADGTAYGVDVSAQFQEGPVRLDATYGYGQVTYQAAQNSLGAWVDAPIVEYSPPHDRRHKVGLTARVDASVLTANVRWQYSSGLPFTKVYGFDTLLEVRGRRQRPFEDIGTPRALFERPYEARLPAYHRLDVSVQRTFDVTSNVSVETEAGAINTYDRANVFYVDIFTLDRVDQLPLIPYLSLTINVQ